MRPRQEREKLREDLRLLQHSCQGQKKNDLYDLIGIKAGQPRPDHKELRKQLNHKQDRWSSDASGSNTARVQILEQALNLLKEPEDQGEYDDLLRELARSERQRSPANPQHGGYQQPPLQPPQYGPLPDEQPWGYQQSPAPQPPPERWRQRQQPQHGLLGRILSAIILGPLKLAVTLAVFAAGLAMLIQLTTGALNWLDSPWITPGIAPSESGAEPETVGAGAGASTRVATETPRPSPRPRETTRTTSAESDGTPATPLPQTGRTAATVAAATVSPTNAPGTRPMPGPTEETPNRNTRRASTAPPQAAMSATASVAAEPAPPDPPPLVEPLRVGGNVPQPRRTWNVTPEYPRMARLRRVQGIVILEVTVDRQGAVSSVSVLRSAEGLDEAAVEAVRQWRYEPTIMNGRAVSVIFTETVRFEI